MRLGPLAAIALLGSLAACGARTQLPTPGAREGASGAGGAAQSSSASTTSTGAGGSGGEPVDAGTDAPPLVENVYVHGGSTLYQLDLESHNLVTIGNFAGCNGSVVDIALSRDGRLFGTTFNTLFSIDLASAACKPVGTGAYPNSLGFVPDPSVPDGERLVGYVGAAYVVIDTQNGAVTQIGDIGGSGLTSSGDLMILPTGRVYVSVLGPGCLDCLVEIDPATGQLIEIVGDLDYSGVYGLASSEGIGYGFTQAGEAFTIDLDDADTLPFAILNAPQGLSFYGAASKPPPR